MRVLMPVDPFNDGPSLVATAAPWLSRLKAVVDLLYVDVHFAELQRRMYLGPSDRERLAAQAAEKVVGLYALLPEACRAAVDVDEGRVAERVVARSERADLVMVGTTGRAGPARWWLGSEAERIVRASEKPVLVTRPLSASADAPLRVLCAVDLKSELADATVEALARFWPDTPARVDLLYVDETPPWVPVVAEPSVNEVLLERIADYRARQVERLARLSTTLLPASVRGGVHVEEGPPANAIARAADDYDLVVVGSRGRRGLARWLGSVAERVVRRAPVSVLVLHPH